MQKKEDKVGNKTTNNEGKKQKKKARENDRNRFAYAWKTKKAVKLRQISRKIWLFFLQNSF